MLSGLDFTNYRIDPRSDFSGSNLENCKFDDAWFGFDFEHQVNFSNTYLKGVRFPDPNAERTAPGKRDFIFFFVFVIFVSICNL